MSLNERKKIFAINGSPNKNRNTATLMKWVAEGVESGGIDVEWVHVADMDLNYCKGCHGCLKTGTCVQKDEISVLINKLQKANGVIVGSPVYESGPTAQLKTIMDRITLLCLYAGIMDDKLSIGVSTSGVAPTKKVAKTISNIFGRRLGVIGAKTATIKGGYSELSKKNDPKTKEKARELGKNLAKKCIKGERIFSLKAWWIHFLRTKLLKKLIMNNQDEFAGIIDIWKENKWI